MTIFFVSIQYKVHESKMNVLELVCFALPYSHKIYVFYNYALVLVTERDVRAFMPSIFKYNTLHFMPSICT